MCTIVQHNWQLVESFDMETWIWRASGKVACWFLTVWKEGCSPHIVQGSGMCMCVCIVVQLLVSVRLFATPWTIVHQASLSFTISWSLLKLMSIELVMTSNHLILYCPLRLLPSIFPSIRVFSNESALCIRWPKYWSFSFNIIRPMNTQDWSPLGWTAGISLQSKGL